MSFTSPHESSTIWNGYGKRRPGSRWMISKPRLSVSGQRPHPRQPSEPRPPGQRPARLLVARCDRLLRGGRPQRQKRRRLNVGERKSANENSQQVLSRLPSVVYLYLRDPCLIVLTALRP